MNVIKRLSSQQHPTATELAPALHYIDSYLPKLLQTTPPDSRLHIQLPHPYIVPSQGDKNFVFNEQYYWDSYFSVLGLTEPEHQPLVEGMLENLLHLYKTYGIIPNASRVYMLSRSQPPVLTSYIFLVYRRYDKSKQWLASRIKIAQDEYHTVWTNTKHPYWHSVHHGLSRYYDINALHDLAEAESGWDMTPRFERKALDYLPIDLNCLLYKYETDFADAARIFGDTKQATQWQVISNKRRASIQRMFWGKLRGFYFDYNYQKQELGNVWSLAAYYTMWSGVATDEQAQKLVSNLRRFEHRYGLSTTSATFLYKNLFGSTKTQWAHPNGWAPLHYIVTEGLERYGYHTDAQRIAQKWLQGNLIWFKQHHEFIEKYNVVNAHKRPVEGVYPSQSGFGWTNSVFSYYADKYFSDRA